MYILGIMPRGGRGMDLLRIILHALAANEALLSDEAAFRAETHKSLAGLTNSASIQRSLLQELNRKVEAMSAATSDLGTSISQIVSDNAALKAQIDAAPAAIATLVATAVAAQVSLGVTPDQLKILTDLHTVLGGETEQLKNALAGTPPPPPVVTPPVMTTPAPPTVDPTTGLPIPVVTPPGGTLPTGTVDPATGLPVA